MRLPLVQSLFGIGAAGAIFLLPTGAGVPGRQDNHATAANQSASQSDSQSVSQPIVLTPAIKAALNPSTIAPFPPEQPKSALEALANAIFPHPARKQGPELAYAPEAASPLPGADTATDVPKPDLVKPAEVVFPPHPDAAAIREALDAYRKNDFVRGDAAAKNASDPLARTALEWAAMRLQPRPAGFTRLIAFADQHPQWPSDSFMRGRAEDALYGDKNLAQARAYFARHTPVSASGRLAKARLLIADKHTKEAAVLVAQVWRNEDIGAWTETALKKDFGDLLTVQDHKFRSDRLFYKEKYPASLRAAAFVSPDYVALAKARNAVANEEASDKLMEAVPKTMRGDPTYLFARIQILRRAGKTQEAAATMMTAPDSAEALVSGDDWWTERRLITRKLLDEA
ncbi:MAG: Soluble lytic murein transglycosylase, partial [Betaproteobacteria bacterium]|nr:Soluble lytic murein transglycosylase [Betaproteobacteria bacterium]